MPRRKSAPPESRESGATRPAVLPSSECQRPEKPARFPEKEPSPRRCTRPRLCKHCAASARRRSSSGSRILLPIRHFSKIDSDLTQKITETRVGTERTKLRTKHIAVKCAGMLLDRAVKPAKRFVFFAERYIHGSD